MCKCTRQECVCVWVWEKDNVDWREEGGQFILEVGELMHAIEKSHDPPDERFHLVGCDPENQKLNCGLVVK